MERYPLMLSLAGRRVVVVGGGRVALRRVCGLLDAGANVIVVAPAVLPELAELPVTVLPRPYREGDLAAAWLGHAATSDPAVNARVAAEAERNRIWCVRADDAAVSAAWTPAVTRHGEVTVAVTAGGDPGRSQRLRAAIAQVLADGTLPVRPRRPRADHTLPDHKGPDQAVPDHNGPDYNGPDHSGPDHSGPDQTEPGRRRPDHGRPDHGRPDHGVNPGVGSVALIGGGPGDPGLITVLGRRLLAEADVVVTDKLAPRSLLAELDPDVEIIDAGKRPHAHNLTQAQINELIVTRAQAGQRVVRLKGGDPFVFGRGGEEALACVRAGVPFRVVPGVTSAIAVPAYAGIPVTHRGVTQDFSVVSAHLDPSQPGATVDWEGLARSTGTLVLLMAVAHLDAVAAELIKRGRSAATPVAVICDGTTADQQVLVSTLECVAADAESARVAPPAVVVIGEVVRLRDMLLRPTSGATVPGTTVPGTTVPGTTVPGTTVRGAATPETPGPVATAPGAAA
ncbi:MAG TPA: uroporphyrinogen-III C-methyltransferase [Streptosporangiaceae bacterium]|nr:uroporphyrinogen-III C-methyltransferase [Streptosporangiaceae bacterium]